MELVKCEYTSDLRQVGAMRDLVRDTCRRVWNTESDQAIDQLILAVDEAAMNVILHAYQQRPDQPIQLVMEIDDAEAIVSLYHCGPNFDPPPPQLDIGKESGYGLYLIQHTVDDVRYFRDEQGRCAIRLVKKRR
jgi:anti-sigma regulatory factor (Ser/Thr protein kinase)